MAITAAQVKELREMTGAGMMDCKKALGATDGDLDKAVEWLRENGLAKAAKKASRIAAEGMVAVNVSEDGKVASIVEVNSETDFVAKNEKFQTFVAEVAAQAQATNAANIEEFMAEKWNADDAGSVEEKLKAMIAVIGENMNIRRFEKIETEGVIVSYIHAGGKIGVLVIADTDNATDGVKEALKNVAMQVAALNPKYVSKDDIPAEAIEQEREVILHAALNENAQSNKPKPENIIAERIVPGRLEKQLKEICLLSQAFVKNPDQTVEAYVQGAKSHVVTFVRLEVGEGIEKAEIDFAAEVAAQSAAFNN